VIPVIIGATGTISKSFRKYVSNIPGNHEVRELQKTTILGTAHILRKLLTEKYNRANAGTGDIGTINSNDRIAATMCSLGTWFVSGIRICTNTLHKGAKDDDDDDDDNNNNNTNNNINNDRHTVLHHINSIILNDCKVFRDVFVNQVLNNQGGFTALDCLLYDRSYII
jgi:hypothetical protein